RRFQVHMTESGARPSNLNSAASALRFFFGKTLDWARRRQRSQKLGPRRGRYVLHAIPCMGLVSASGALVAWGKIAVLFTNAHLRTHNQKCHSELVIATALLATQTCTVGTQAPLTQGRATENRTPPGQGQAVSASLIEPKIGRY